MIEKKTICTINVKISLNLCYTYSFTVHSINAVWQMEMQTGEPLVPETSTRLKLLLKSWTDNCPGLIQAGGKMLCSEIHRLTDSLWGKEEQPQQWK